jgi:hypothetical protein
MTDDRYSQLGTSNNLFTLYGEGISLFWNYLFENLILFLVLSLLSVF